VWAHPVIYPATKYSMPRYTRRRRRRRRRKKEGKKRKRQGHP
jgi:hypothetical protein